MNELNRREEMISSLSDRFAKESRNGDPFSSNSHEKQYSLFVIHVKIEFGDGTSEDWWWLASLFSVIRDFEMIFNRWAHSLVDLLLSTPI